METEAVFVPGCKYALNVFKLGMSPWESVEVGSLSDGASSGHYSNGSI